MIPIFQHTEDSRISHEVYHLNLFIIQAILNSSQITYPAHLSFCNLFSLHIYTLFFTFQFHIYMPSFIFLALLHFQHFKFQAIYPFTHFILSCQFQIKVLFGHHYALIIIHAIWQIT